MYQLTTEQKLSNLKEVREKKELKYNNLARELDGLDRNIAKLEAKLRLEREQKGLGEELKPSNFF